MAQKTIKKEKNNINDIKNIDLVNEIPEVADAIDNVDVITNDDENISKSEATEKLEETVLKVGGDVMTTADDTEEPKNEDINEEDNIEDEDINEEQLCRIIVATPTYYVINKDGESVTINEKNDYRRGDEVLI